jgi:hypothetical protein
MPCAGVGARRLLPDVRTLELFLCEQLVEDGRLGSKDNLFKGSSSHHILAYITPNQINKKYHKQYSMFIAVL